ncbi:hypothetical protein KK062_20920 [Fulvivirgaceae bacterium PWU5]|uniref:Uncharacterized protein n=1 Tax=Dawidia cretensis TaxID=2782350 RepID=A0AAP2E0G7_9BACT|nr:hypothetical protein [Dawidia cretensis]MBT1710716.1 hypothetical protein [Dawidia cretensis]
MKSEEISNLLLVLVAIAWYTKIWLHFNYLRVSKAEFNGLNLVSFLTNPANFFKIIAVVSPIFFPTGDSDVSNTKVEKRKVWISILFLWVVFGVGLFYLYKHPPSRGVKKIEYDFTKSPTE